MLKRFRPPITFQGVDHQEGEAILDVNALCLRYDRVSALEDVNFRLNTGERVAVIGPNGAGKSSLFKVISGVEAPTAGQVRVFGHGPSRHICIAYVPQRSQVDWKFPASVADVVMMGRVRKIGLLHWPRRHDWQKVHQALELVGMHHLADRQIGELSGGQQQRVFVAQALAQEADLILMDEPLTGLDAAAQEKIFAILDELSQQRITVLIATHDLALAGERFDRVMLLNRRLLAFGQPQDILTAEKLVAAYGGQLHVIGSGPEEVLLVEDACHDHSPESADAGDRG